MTSIALGAGISCWQLWVAAINTHPDPPFQKFYRSAVSAALLFLMNKACLYVNHASLVVLACSRADAAWRLSRFRMPSVFDHLRVILRSKQPLQAGELRAELAALGSRPADVDYRNIYDQPLELGALEVVAIFALLPPQDNKNQKLTNSAMQALVRKVTSAQAALRDMWRRFLLFTQMAHYGWSAVTKMNSWIQSLRSASQVSELTDVYDSSMHDLQTLSVAVDKKRQGLGSSVMQLAKHEILQEQGSGMRGLCQSDATRLFYEKQGFASRDVFTHPLSDLLHTRIRKHFLVSWNARLDVEDSLEVHTL